MLAAQLFRITFPRGVRTKADTHSTDRVTQAVLLFEAEGPLRAGRDLDGIFQLEVGRMRHVPFAGNVYGPARPGIAVDGMLDRETVLRAGGLSGDEVQCERRAGVLCGNHRTDEFAEHIIPVRRTAGPVTGQQRIGQGLDAQPGDGVRRLFQNERIRVPIGILPAEAYRVIVEHFGCGAVGRCCLQRMRHLPLSFVFDRKLVCQPLLAPCQFLQHAIALFQNVLLRNVQHGFVGVVQIGQ
jgi:hypothetical protein